MSAKHPIIAVTGASGSGRRIVSDAFANMFRRLDVNPVFVDGESFHRYDREAMKKALAAAESRGDYHFSHFGPEANLFDELASLYETYGECGRGRHRKYLHNEEDAKAFASLGLKPGQFTPWEDIPEGTDTLVYTGLHGCVVCEDGDAKQHVDLKIGVTPIINLEWIQKIHRDTSSRGYTEEQVMGTILRRMHDYVHYIIPQFKNSDINFQRVPVVDTSDPIVARDVPADGESLVVVRYRRPEDFDVDFPYFLRNIQGSYMSRRNTIVLPGESMGLAMELMLTPIIVQLMEKRGAALEG